MWNKFVQIYSINYKWLIAPYTLAILGHYLGKYIFEFCFSQILFH